MSPKLMRDSRANSAFISCVSGGGSPFVSRPRISSPSVRFVRFACCRCNRRQKRKSSAHISKCRQTFSKRMAQAGLNPHHRIALGVSGGPDSMALCVLAAEWKTHGLLAIVIDHDLRVVSKEEATVVREHVSKIGISCEVLHCEWKDGRSDSGHLEVVAREMSLHRFDILLVAHHVDDQTELFSLRLSRNSGVLGLAGMAFTSQFFSKHKY